MSRGHSTKWSKSDSEKLSKAVKNFNAKITRIEKKNPELKEALPEKESVKQLKKLINTSIELQQEIDRLNRFTNKSNKISKLENGKYEGIEIYGDYNKKITKWQTQELSKAVKNFNAKITRIEKKNPELANVLPQKKSVKHLKTLISTSDDLKQEIASLNRFTNRSNKISKLENGEYEGIETIGNYNVKVTTWEKEEIEKRIPVINERRKERLEYLENLELIAGGEILGYTKGDLGMGKLERVDLEPMKGLETVTSQRDLIAKSANVFKESDSGFLRKKDYQCRENYIKGLKEQYQRNEGKDIEDVVEKIEKMDIDDFLFTFYSDQNADFDEIYYPNDDEYQGYLSRLKTVWKV